MSRNLNNVEIKKFVTELQAEISKLSGQGAFFISDLPAGALLAGDNRENFGELNVFKWGDSHGIRH